MWGYAFKDGDRWHVYNGLLTKEAAKQALLSATFRFKSLGDGFVYEVASTIKWEGKITDVAP